MPCDEGSTKKLCKHKEAPTGVSRKGLGFVKEHLNLELIDE